MRTVLDTLRREAESTIRDLYALQQFKLLLVNKECVNKINENVCFWSIFERSLLTKLFIGIRRLYERNKDTFNFQRALNMINDNIGEFNKSSIERRKLEGLSKRPEWMDTYMESIYTPTKNDFRVLAKLVRLSNKRMKIYIDAANNVFAHAIHTDANAINKSLASLNFEEIEDALNVIWHFYEQVWQMYENGIKPTLQIRPYPHKEEVQKSVIIQLAAAV